MTTALVVLLCVHTLGTLISRWLDRRDTARLVVRLEAIADTLCRVPVPRPRPMFVGTFPNNTASQAEKPN